MKRISALLLLVCLLVGCGFAGQINFNDIEYSRPDPEALRAAVDDVEQALEYGDSLRRVMTLLDECYELFYDYDTMYVLADIRSCQDVTDGFYAAELAWCEENYARVSQMMEELYIACGSSELALELEAEYFWEGFAQDYAPGTENFYNAELTALFEKEAELMSEYRKLLSKPVIEIDGREVDYYSFLESCSEQEYYRAQELYYKKYNEPLGEIYISLVQLRHELAKAAGFDSYRQMQFEYYFERSYSPEEADAYAAAVKEQMVPLYKELMADDPYSQIDYSYLSENELHRILQTAAHSMGGEIAQAFDFMSDYDYYDIEQSPVKAALSFQTYLPSYGAPFLFLDPYGDTEDILGFAHEFGHYVDAWYNGDIQENIDASECFSQAMEYLLLCCVDESERDNLELMRLLDTVDVYVQQASFYEFEQRVYAAKELSLEYLNELSLELAADYGYYDAQYRDYYSLSWIDVPHFFEMPFYVISYPVSNDIALQIYAAELEEEGAGLELFYQMLKNPHANLAEIVENTGIESPFSENSAAHISKLFDEIKNEAA